MCHSVCKSHAIHEGVQATARHAVICSETVMLLHQVDMCCNLPLVMPSFEPVLMLALLFVQLEQSLDATFVFGAASMIGHSPQTPQEMYTNGKAG